MSDATDRKKEPKEHRGHYYSCAFCHADSPKPFDVCKSCGAVQPDSEEE